MEIIPILLLEPPFSMPVNLSDPVRMIMTASASGNAVITGRYGMAVYNEIGWFAGTDVEFDFVVLQPNSPFTMDITGESFIFIVRQDNYLGSVALTCSTSNGGIVLTAPTAGRGKISIAAALSALDTSKLYYYSFGRNDLGAKEVDAYGPALVQPNAIFP